MRRGRNGASAVGTRRSARSSTMNANGKREGSSDSGLWRGERRSARLGGPDVLLDDEPSHKRARTEESTTSAHSTDPPAPDNLGVTNGIRVKTAGAAKLKPTEVAMEQVPGKKRSKFWVYAVEPVSEPDKPPPSSSDGDVEMNDIDGNGTWNLNGHSNTVDHDRSLERSISPVHSY